MVRTHRVKNKVRLMDRINQTVILDNGSRYMETDIVNVWREKGGKEHGKIKPTGSPVVFDDESRVWRLTA